MAITQELQDAIDTAYGNFVLATNAVKVLYLDNERNKEILEEVLRRQPGSVADWVHPQMWTMAWLDAQSQLEQPVIDERPSPEQIREREYKLAMKDFRDGSPAGNRTSFKNQKDLRAMQEGIVDLIIKEASDLEKSLPQPAAPPRELPTPEQIADGTELSKREMEKLTNVELKNYIRRTRVAEEIVRQRNLERD